MGFQGREDGLVHACGSRPGIPIARFVEVHTLLKKFEGESCFENLQDGGIVFFV
jgi:hypothetical protein